MSPHIRQGCLLTPEREPTTDQSTDTIQVHLDEPMSYAGVTYGSRNIFKTASLPNATPTWVTSHKTGSSTGSTGWSVSFPGLLAVLNLFQPAWLVWVFFAALLIWEFSLQLPSFSLRALSFYCLLWQEGAWWSLISFRNFLKLRGTILNCLPSCLMLYPRRKMPHKSPLPKGMEPSFMSHCPGLWSVCVVILTSLIQHLIVHTGTKVVI